MNEQKKMGQKQCNINIIKLYRLRSIYGQFMDFI